MIVVLKDILCTTINTDLIWSISHMGLGARLMLNQEEFVYLDAREGMKDYRRILKYMTERSRNTKQGR